MRYKILPEWDFCREALSEGHVLMGGRTGSGKSTLMADFLYTITAESHLSAEMVLIDLKRVELVDWKDFPHTKRLVTEPEDLIPCLDWLIAEMNARYRLMQKKHQKLSTCRDLYVVIDELAQVLTVKGAEDRIDELLRLGRAARIVLVMATQNVSRGKGGVPARIWQNVSCRIGLHCTTPIESRQVIGMNGCESLPRYGECLIVNADGVTKWFVPVTTYDMIIERLFLHRTGKAFPRLV